MGRERVSKGQIIMKKEEKLPKVAIIMEVGFSDDDFIEKFKTLYPKDWGNIVKRYNEHERLTKPGKTHPMPEPKKYLLNVAKKYLNEVREKHSQGWRISNEEREETLEQIRNKTKTVCNKKIDI